MLKRFFLATLLFVAAGSAAAVDYTDIWWLPAETGWGVNVVQSDTFMFVTFFIYGTDGKPTWYTANLYQDATGNFSGLLYATIGTPFAMPWVPAQVIQAAVGTASFQPTGPYTAKLVYILTSGPILATVTKAIQRQNLTAITVGGTYSGAQAGAYTGSGCPMPYRDYFDLQVSQSTNGAVSFVFSYTEGLTCTLSGTLEQHGQLYSVPNATYQCSTGLKTSASMTEIKATAQGVEGLFSAPSVGGGCREDAQFSGVLD
jgi:hypothetical protein